MVASAPVKVKRLIPFDDAPAWLSHVEIERDGDKIRFTAVKRSDIELGSFSIDIDKMIKTAYEMKKED